MGPMVTHSPARTTRSKAARVAGPPPHSGLGRQVAAGAAALAVLAARAKDGPLGSAERQLPGRLQGRRTPSGIAAARAVSSLAEPGFVSALLAVRALAVWQRDGWQAACVPGLVVGTGAVARRRLSRVIRRSRPPESGWLTEPEGFSLPSKHTALGALTAGALAGGAGGGSRAGQAAPLLAAALVGTSRVYLGVHWPTDVLAGWLFAEGWLRLARAVTEAGQGLGPRFRVGRDVA